MFNREGRVLLKERMRGAGRRQWWGSSSQGSELELQNVSKSG